MNRILVVGGGPAGHRLAGRLRHHGALGPVKILGAEPSPAYHRPLLSYILSGQADPEALRMPALPGIETHSGAAVTHIDRVRREVHTAESVHGYDVLVLATGARADVPDIRGARGPGVTVLRTVADCARVTGDTVAVLGGGPLGVETAAALAARGTATTLVCAAPHPLYGRLGESASALLTDALRRAGVDVLAGRTVTAREPGRVLLDDGTRVPADTLVLCTGAHPEVRLARAAGLRVRTGIVVDDQLRTSDPRIHAIGDCAEHEGRTVAGIEAAWAQADSLARVLTGQDASAHRTTPAVFRLRTRIAEVACVGAAGAFADPALRRLTLADREGGRYARLAMSGERLVAAVLFGLPEAVAAVGELYRRGQALPSDRLQLLLGGPPRPASTDLDPSEDAVICLCNNVQRRALAKAWRAGARTVTALAAATRATTGCGGCGGDVAELSARWAREMRYDGKRTP
ncbi:assimilatory nitrate reductase electron transfer subunit [Streptomyces sp. B3I7]|uniref:NAD(P)/FAD-dependent oxidoreductase n=1 Tax=unclassified Streptomyces TaxID=2593676 RepID=UPI00278A5918|nr:MULTISPECIES: FAD-dependent oxidoreductase [unclassified Streptomyces]MDQ0784873.1 assimilatory nitrate reductase electron transfer subunit [Streptomyces sp. B3I8]MDQ0808652.1 assimilatory nitrate reductase electron transfer subunit [Streptomyces sp. B3I7]